MNSEAKQITVYIYLDTLDSWLVEGEPWILRSQLCSLAPARGVSDSTKKHQIFQKNSTTATFVLMYKWLVGIKLLSLSFLFISSESA